MTAGVFIAVYSLAYSLFHYDMPPPEETVSAKLLSHLGGVCRRCGARDGDVILSDNRLQHTIGAFGPLLNKAAPLTPATRGVTFCAGGCSARDGLRDLRALGGSSPGYAERSFPGPAKSRPFELLGGTPGDSAPLHNSQGAIRVRVLYVPRNRALGT